MKLTKEEKSLMYYQIVRYSGNNAVLDNQYQYTFKVKDFNEYLQKMKALINKIEGWK